MLQAKKDGALEHGDWREREQENKDWLRRVRVTQKSQLNDAAVIVCLGWQWRRSHNWALKHEDEDEDDGYDEYFCCASKAG